MSFLILCDANICLYTRDFTNEMTHRKIKATNVFFLDVCAKLNRELSPIFAFRRIDYFFGEVTRNLVDVVVAYASHHQIALHNFLLIFLLPRGWREKSTQTNK